MYRKGSDVMSYIGALIDEGRRCAGVIDSLAIKVGELTEDETNKNPDV